MNNSLQIYKSSTYMQNILQNKLNGLNGSNYLNNIDEEEINNLLKQTYELLNSDKNSDLKLDINYNQYIEYLLNLINNHFKIYYTEENILQYIILVDYFQLKIKDEIFNFVLRKFVLNKNIFYNKLYLYQPFNCYILNEFSEENNINSNTFKYIFEINKNICNEITTLYSKCIYQNSLNKCKNIINLNIANNSNVKNVNYLQKLEKLDISCGYGNGCNCGVNQNGISKLLNVKKLNVSNNCKIVDVNHFQQLEELNASSNIDDLCIQLYDCGLNQNGISNLISIKILNVYGNNKITDVNHLQQLEELNISNFKCGVKQNGISKLLNIKKLVANDNSNIVDVNHLQQLEELHIENRCGVNCDGISQLTLIKKLYASYNKKITNDLKKCYR